jgi:hypothetical protein
LRFTQIRPLSQGRFRNGGNIFNGLWTTRLFRWKLVPPPFCGGSSRDLCPFLRSHLRRPSLPAPRTQLGGSALDAIRFQFLGFLAGCDPHDLDGVADHVGAALLASGTSWH